MAFVAYLWGGGVPWPWLYAIVMVALPMGVALNLVVWLCRGYFPMEVVITLKAYFWACQPIGATLALACPSDGYFPK